MIWYIERLDRFIAERRGIAALAGEVDWLTVFDFSFEERDRLHLRFTVVVDGKPVELELRYPRFYPDAPPEIVPCDPNLRLADHQWSGGSLCLEYRADNWRPEITAADMVRSAHTLLSAERQAVDGARGLPSVHDRTFGQALRATRFRHLYSDALLAKLREHPPSTPMMATLRWDRQSDAIISWIEVIDFPDGQWRQIGFPDFGYQMQGIAIWAAEGEDPEAVLNGQDGEMPKRLAELASPDEVSQSASRFVFASATDYPRFMWRVPQDAQQLTPFLCLNAGSFGFGRAVTNPFILAERKVAVVGCGSAGSKIAAALARAGVGSFLLVDDDVMMRGNLVRNDLDWHGVGEHKVHALGARLKLINPDLTVTSFAIRLGGQEASSSVDTVLEALSTCDLIVDAAVNSDAFNLVSAVATRSGTPMVWLEIFEGGLGGMIARYRPGQDATPKDMRSAYLNWCRERRAPWVSAEAADYGSRDEDGLAIAADDAEVGIIANHAARFALDALVAGVVFPHSMYVIGMRARWIFNAPFEVHPVDCQVQSQETVALMTEEDTTDAIEFLRDLLGKRDDEARSS